MLARKMVWRAPSAMAASGLRLSPLAMITSQPAPVAILAAISLDVMPPRPKPEMLPPAIASISAVMAATSGICCAAASRRGIGGIKPIHIRQQDQLVGAHHRGDPRAQPVIVAEADFGGRHRVVLVDHRHRAQIEQGVERGAGIEIAVRALRYRPRSEESAPRPILARQQVGIGLGQAHLSRRRRRLALFQAQRAGWQLQAACVPARWSRMKPE